MSIQFGRWNFEGGAPAEEYIEKVSAMLAPYGPDSNESYSRGGATVLYRAFRTTRESHREPQPHVLASGAVLTWDGRLDNRAELIGELQNIVTLHSTDVEIVAAALERWGYKCLGKLVGDWALSIWNPLDRCVLLAKDPMGTKHLYYSFDDKQITWCTILDPLVLLAARPFAISEEYVAGWLANQFPAAHVTPYVGIQAVPPSCSVLLGPGKHGTKHTITKYWDFEPDKSIRYRTHAEYEEHFLFALATAVQRRLRSDRPVLAELSGGMDSSSLVCMADLLMGVRSEERMRHASLSRIRVECPRLDTISWFGDFYEHLDPGTNEFHWISKVEQQRGRAGFHINLNQLRSKEARSQTAFMSAFDSGGFASTLAPKSLSRFFRLYAAHISSEQYRVTLSGVGGDNVTGRQPDPKPELQNLVARGRLVTLAHQLNDWAITLKEPRMSLLWGTIRDFFAAQTISKDILFAPWIHSDFIHRNRADLCNHSLRVNLFDHLPSVQHTFYGLDAERRLAAYWDHNPHLIREVRYPYLDRDFLRFMYAIPREQIVQKGEHRFLMRRALAGIVPDEVLNRKQRPFRRPESENQAERARSAEALRSVEIDCPMVCASIGLIDAKCFFKSLQVPNLEEQEGLMQMLTRTLKLEAWLRHLASKQILVKHKICGHDYLLRAQTNAAVASRQSSAS